MRVAVSGAAGRLGRALVAALEEAPYAGPFGPIAWSRPAFDLDAPDGFAGLLARDRPEVVVHAAAWTDVDGCARDPATAMRRNAEATAILAGACAERGVDLVVVSTNEVFDGSRTDGRGYRPDDPVAPPNPYGLSKAAAEAAAEVAYAGVADPATFAGGRLLPYAAADRLPSGPQLAIVRTAWLYGPPGDDFPDRILAAAGRAAAEGRALRVVDDEWGDPTRSADLAEAIAELLGAGAFGGRHHLVNPGPVTRATWARACLERHGLAVAVEAIGSDAWPRDSVPPRWGVLEPTPLPSGEPMRRWTEALDDDVAWRRRVRAAVR